ncbi:hypothetical protein ACJDT4_08265 [Clostridium neuense]|uniref:Spore coat protein n=1 Tax=Clostridium neuense TaxID=1728934 RepID=A0ABW8TF89_9CLOT
MSSAKLTPYENLMIKEILSNEVNELKKLTTYIELCKDDKLNFFVEKRIDSKKNNIKAIQNFLGKSE